jgi:dipeptidyl aminopeptidase/acylaminoacyl peptidase
MVMLAATAAGLVQAQTDPRIPQILNELEATRHFSEVTMSPDGAQAAWVEEGNSSIYLKPLGSTAAPVRLGAGHGLAWSPDSSRIAFLSNDAQPQLSVIAVRGGKVKTLTSLKGFLTGPQWSPDGSKIAVLFAENAVGGGGPLEAEPIETGVIGGEIHNQRLTIVDANSGAVKQLSPGDLNIYEYDWSPDGKTFVVSAAPGPADNNWWIAQLYTMPVDSGKMTAIFKPETQVAMPRWSPDGRSIAFIQGLMSDEGFTGGDVFTIAASGGAATNRTPGRKTSPSGFVWISPQKLLFTEYTGGSSAVATLDLASGQVEQLAKDAENLHIGGNFGNFSPSRDGKTVAAIRDDFDHAPEIWAGPVGSWKAVTQSNSARRPQWGKVQNIEWTNDGLQVQGWLLYPHDFDPSKRYGMIVSPHGGPANLVTPAWPGPLFNPAILAALGYFVFFPNPRGSYGQGESFTRGNVKDFGYGDLRDVMSGVDAVLKMAPVDPEKLGITGWSYGGYMTMWTVTQTNRFKAAVAGAGIANWQSYYGENSIDEWMLPYFGASVYDDPAVYAKSAPITFIKQVRTPTLVVVGERDGECPSPQSYEFWHALKALGVPTELVVYAGEGHMFRKPENKRDVIARTLAWFEQYLK